jgi:hypothetical protein
MSERTLILVKPDGVRRRLVGEVIAPHRAQGPDDQSSRDAHDLPGHRRAPLRRARRQALLRGARGLHHRRTPRRDDRRGPDAVAAMRGSWGRRTRSRPHRVRSAVISRPRSARTSSTAPTRPTTASGRSRSSSADEYPRGRLNSCPQVGSVEVGSAPGRRHARWADRRRRRSPRVPRPASLADTGCARCAHDAARTFRPGDPGAANPDRRPRGRGGPRGSRGRRCRPGTLCAPRARHQAPCRHRDDGLGGHRRPHLHGSPGDLP